MIGTTSAWASESPIARTKLENTLKELIASGTPNRSVGHPGHDAAYRYIKEKFQNIAKAGNSDVHVYEHEFLPDVDFAAKNYQQDFDAQVEGKIPPTHPDYKKWKSFTRSSIDFVRSYKNKKGKNLVLEFKGRIHPEEVIYLGAHFDSITHDHETMRFTPDAPTDGADDNATAVAAVIDIAEALKNQPHDRTIRLVAFDYEEIFFLGSYAFAKDLKAGKISWAKKGEKNLGLLVLEMIGWSQSPATKHPVVKLYAREPGQNEANNDLPLAKMFQAATEKIGSKIRPEISQNGFNRSDNWSFWQFGYPAICVSQDWENDFDEKNYHTGHDSIENLNLDYATAITNTTLETLNIAATTK